MEEPNLESLLQAYRQGDEASLGRIVERTRRPLHRYILGMVGNPHLAEDVFQDVWLRAVRNLHRYHNRHLQAWLFRIARNRIIDLSRKKKEDLSLQQPLGSGEEPVTLESFLASSDSGPARHAGDRELGQRIRAAVSQLPPEQREVFVLRMESDLPFKEIATLQGVSINTALGRMQYALRRLREALADDAPPLSQPGDLT